jgi:hypothetical protein
MRVALALLLVTCVPRESAPPPANVEQGRHWQPATADVYISSEMSPECRVSAYQAVQAVRRRGVPATSIFVTEDHPVLALEPRYGEVAIKAGLPSDNAWEAEVLLWEDGPDVLAADIILGDCARRVAAAELLDVFGLEAPR